MAGTSQMETAIRRVLAEVLDLKARGEDMMFPAPGRGVRFFSGVILGEETRQATSTPHKYTVLVYGGEDLTATNERIAGCCQSDPAADALEKGAWVDCIWAAPNAPKIIASSGGGVSTSADWAKLVWINP